MPIFEVDDQEWIALLAGPGCYNIIAAFIVSKVRSIHELSKIAFCGLTEQINYLKTGHDALKFLRVCRVLGMLVFGITLRFHLHGAAVIEHFTT
jgi:hypothetical protein